MASIWDRKYSENIRSAWTANPLVFEEVNRRMTSTSKFWLNWVFEDYFSSSIPQMLAIGCGDGSHELSVSRNGWAKNIDAFDASEVGIRMARQNAEIQGLEINFYVDTFENFARSPVTKIYDLITFIGSLHHVRDLESMLAAVRRSLAHDGCVMFNEYVGPCYNIYPPERVSIINCFLTGLSPVFKVSPSAQWSNPTIEMAHAHDPTESVRSALIVPLLEHFFEVTHRRYFGGALLHPIFDHLNGAKLADGSPESESVVRLLIQAENLLTEAGALPNDFCFGFCRLKT